MKISIAQTNPIKGNIEENIKNHIKWIEKAVINNAHMIVFPELSITGYEPQLAESLAIDKNDSRLDIFQEISDNSKLTIGIGAPTKIENCIFISMIIFTPNKEKTIYSKQYLYPTETSIFTPSKNKLILELHNEKIAPAICYELSNKEHYEYAYKNDCTIYLASVLNSINGIDGDLEKLGEIAKNYKMITLMSNYVGDSGDYKCAGKSSIWNSDGELIEQLDSYNEGLIILDTLDMKLKKIVTTQA